MHIGIDIDGTIAGRNMEAFAAACDKRFGLGIAPEERYTYASLMTHPGMQAQQQTASVHFEAAISSIEQSPSMLHVLPPLPGAVAGVQRLSRYSSDLAYYTVRKAFPPYSSEEVEQSTKTWLLAHAFPRPDRVVFCMSLMNKLLQVYQHLQAQPKQFLFIDDLAPELHEACLLLQAGRHPRFTKRECQQICELLQRYLVLVAFGASSPIAINSDFQVASLPTWEDVDALIAFFHQ